MEVLTSGSKADGPRAALELGWVRYRWKSADALSIPGVDHATKIRVLLQQCLHDGTRRASIKKGLNTAVGLAGLPGKLTSHTPRQTAPTWLVQRGVPLWEAAVFLGYVPRDCTTPTAITTPIFSGGRHSHRPKAPICFGG